MTGRDDLLSTVITAGGLLGLAQAMGDSEARLLLIVEAQAMADGLQGYDPVAAGVIRQRANAVLHGEMIIDSTATDILTTVELESGK